MNVIHREPTFFPTDRPTESPNVETRFIGCGETREDILPQNDVQFVGFVIIPDTVRVSISTCSTFTVFETSLELRDGGFNLIASDTGSCGLPGNQAEIDIPSGLPQTQITHCY